MKVTTASLLLEYLKGEGVEYIFGVPGTSLVPLFDAIVFVDTGNHTCWALDYLKFDTPNFFSSFGLLPMGYAIPASIGGKLAAPDRPVIAMVGDGCFLMNGMEVATAVSHGIPVVWIVHNNAKLGLVHELQKFSLGENTVSTVFKRVNAAKVAEGLGAQGFAIERPGELTEVLPKALESKRPTVIDVTIDPDEVPPIERWVRAVGELNARLDYCDLGSKKPERVGTPVWTYPSPTY